MANKTAAPKTAPKEDVENVTEVLSRSEQFIERNQNIFLIALVAVVVIVAGIVLYHNKVVLPKDKAASEQMFQSEQWFAADSMALALNGDDVDNIGFLGVIDQYGSSRTARLAKAYAGLCYKAMGDYESALKYLNAARPKGLMVAPALVGAAGDCYVELEQPSKALACFDKATKSGNEFLTPLYLMKAARVCESMGNYGKALKYYQTIKAEYPASMEGLEVDKYIENAQLQK